VAYFRVQTSSAGGGIYANYVDATEGLDITLVAEMGVFTSVGYSASLLILAPPVDPDITLVAEMGVFTSEGFSATLSFDPPQPVFNVFTYPLDEGSGSIVGCLEGALFNGSIDAGDWSVIPNNNSLWRINEGTGALLEDAVGSRDATIQNFIEGNWATP